MPQHHPTLDADRAMVPAALTALREACTSQTLSDVTLSADGQTLTISSTDHNAMALVNVPVGKDKMATYSLASIYLMLMHPSVLQYRKACESANVKDQVKILDKAGITSYFTGDETQDMDVSDDEGAKRKAQFADEEVSSKHHEDKRHRSTEKQKKKVREEEKKKPAKPTPITNEQLVANLSTIVDKRDKPKEEETQLKKEDSQQITPSTTPIPIDATQDEKERELLLSWLSPEGFDVASPTVAAAIEADREVTQRITDLEIPVGDSSSILRAGAGGEVVEIGTAGVVKKRDFSKVLEIYQEVIQAEEKAKKTSFGDAKRPTPPSASKTVRLAGPKSPSCPAPKKIEGNPIIIVPNAMTCCITLVNAEFFLGKEATFIPRDIAVKRPDCGKRGMTVQITRRLAARLGGGEITYDVIDNPTTRLKKDDWDRVVAVIAQGASWQFKGWRYSDPVELFSKAFGFYVGYEGAMVPAELQGWNVKLGKVSRDRRGLDNICLASFWNG